MCAEMSGEEETLKILCFEILGMGVGAIWMILNVFHHFKNKKQNNTEVPEAESYFHTTLHHKHL